MSSLLGFSTGSLSPGDARRAVEMLRPYRTTAIEISALRFHELDETLALISTPALEEFQYVSFHVPSRLNGLSEVELLTRLEPVVLKRTPIVVHPDVIADWSAWRQLGELVVIENMDGRKPVGRTVAELQLIFSKLPQARFCFDIGHAAQLDPSMKLAYDLVQQLGDRLVEVHLSFVDDRYAHQPLTKATMDRFSPLLCQLPTAVAVILETPVDVTAIQGQIHLANTSRYSG